MEHVKTYEKKSQPMKKFVFGLLVIVAGVLLLLSNMDILPYAVKDAIFSWQMLLIAIGVLNLLSSESRTVGWILVGVGAFFLLPDVFYFEFNFIKLFWPALLIFIGLMIIFTGNKYRYWHKERDLKIEDGFIDETNIFGASERRLHNQVFKGGKITNIFGGSEIDLTQVELQEGRNVLEITCIFGGVELVVPSDWKITTKVSNILGGFGDKRHMITATNDSNKELIITGTMIFGGGELKS